MAHRPDIFAHCYEAGRGVPGVRPHVSSAMFALATVEQQFGTAATLEAALAAWVSVAATLGAVDPAGFKAGVSLLEKAIAKLRSAEEALAAGRVPPGAVVGVVDPSGRMEVRA